MGWPEEHTALLRKLFAEGRVYSDIAVALNRQFGTRYSKAAVIGRGRIIGLPQRRTEPAVKPAAAAPPRPPIQRHGGLKSLPVPACVPVDDVPGGFTLLDLPAAGCRYPHGQGSAIRFCGVPKFAAASYCARHLQLCLSDEGFANFAGKRRAA